MELPYLPEVAAYAAGIILPLCLVFASLRLLFHPLRNYPGPLIAKFTDAYAGYYAYKRSIHLATFQDFQKYGPVVRQGPNRLVFNTLKAVHDIYTNPRVTKGDAYRGSVTSKFSTIINAIDKSDHRRKRKLIGPALTERSMRTFEPVLHEQVDVFLRTLLEASQKHSVVNVSQSFRRLGYDIIGHLAFGYPLKTQTEEANRFVQHIIDLTSWRTYLLMNFPLLSRLELLLVLPCLRESLRFRGLVMDMIRIRSEKPADAHHDLYSMVADHIGKENGFQPAEFGSEAVFFILAGGTTTAATMSAMLFYLTQNPVVHKKLTEEIRNTFESGRDIHAGPKLSSCRYLRACIDETLRMSPPGLGISWRQQLAEDDGPFIVDGHVIPRGTQVGVSVYSILHNEEFFPDPFTFKPERWLREDNELDTVSKEVRDTMQRAFIPFMVGDRSCAGKALAYMEIGVTMARCSWYFDFEPASTGQPEFRGSTSRPGEYPVGDIFIASHEGPNLVFKTRGDRWKELEQDSQ
ncbi:cytochrome P450 [Stachybotrys elegans]|uniref:Cytochrome P450 n=1 Tax=Stachybotrys elegans TaxID=80388 RepID=A0A8K0SHN4_9HYPO|nr:cytochrome P450 [Stachybotrys elegans]